MTINVGINEERILQSLSNDISRLLDSMGIFYRMFYRLKSPKSVASKLKEKADVYSLEGKKMQDLFGVRVTLYFTDDQKIAISAFQSIFTELPDAKSIDEKDGEQFGPQRQNLVFCLPEQLTNQSTIFNVLPIDATFEVQFRTVFSEGWHEIEHDMRYKCKTDWHNELVLSRQLNSQSAVLESCDWVILKILNELAYRKYQDSEWSSFIRNILRLRFSDNNLSLEIVEHLNANSWIPKKLLKSERSDLILPLLKLSVRTPLQMDTVLFIINRVLLKSEGLSELEPALIKSILDNSYGKFSKH